MSIYIFHHISDNLKFCRTFRGPSDVHSMLNIFKPSDKGSVSASQFGLDVTHTSHVAFIKIKKTKKKRLLSMRLVPGRDALQNIINQIHFSIYDDMHSSFKYLYTAKISFRN